MKEKRIGIRFTTKEGYEVIVIVYENANKVQVEFLDEHHYTLWTTWHHVKHGQIKNPYHKSVCNVGYLGLLDNGVKTKVNGKLTREYQLWKTMIYRCYDEKYHEKQATYKDCTVCDRWHCYANFLEDLPKIKNYEYWLNNPNERIALNKDIYYAELGIETDSKEYSLLTTRFVSQSENTLEMLDRCGNPRKVK